MKSMRWMLFVAAIAGCGTGKPVGAACSSNDECTSGECSGSPVMHAKTCRCTADTDCAAGEKCYVLTIDTGPGCGPRPADAGTD